MVAIEIAEQHNSNERLVELAEIKQGDKVLDIATGIGEPAITAARKVGINGHVLATDISPQMLKIAKQRSISFGLQDIVEFKEIDAERIDINLQSLLQLSSFNAVLCRWGANVCFKSNFNFDKYI
jgi:ubiquinone/menaquinone biosynthesis C-methylase UbiE